MKNALLILITIFSLQKSYPQQIFPMFISDNNDKAWSILEIEADKYLITKNKYYNTLFFELKDSLANELIIYDTDENKIISKKAISKHNFTSTFSTIQNKNTNTLINISTPINSPSSSLLITELDYNLNILNQKEIPIDSLILHSAILNDNGNVLIAGVKGASPFNASRSVLIEVNASQGLINYKNLASSPVFVPTALAELNNKYYLYSHSLGFFIFDDNLNLDTIISFSFPGGPLASQKAFVLDSKMYINGVNNSGHYEQLSRIDNNYTIDTILISPYPFGIQATQRGYFSIDGNEDGYLFNSNTIGNCPFYDYSSLCENHFSIRKTDTSGVLHWEYYIGGDATYLVYLVTATSDGGCIVVFDRYEQYDINEDVYYIKFDANGNVDANFFENINTYTGISKIPKIQSVLIFPNPVKDNLNIVSSDYRNKNILIYNEIGKLILKEKIKEKINLLELVTGNYFYSITNEYGKELQKGKFIKE